MSEERDYILELKNVCMKFGGLMAVNEVFFNLERGKILGVIGPNGAGKTTLFNTITGFYQDYTGSVIYNGKNMNRKRVDERCRLGIARTFQVTRPFEQNTLLENVMLGSYFGIEEKRKLNDCEEEAYELLRYVGLSDKSKELAVSLNVAQRKKLELARALSTKPSLLLLDEVIGGLNPTEVVEMMEIIKKINNTGVSILMIEHVMKAITGISDTMVVINHGEKITEGVPEVVMNNPEVIEAYLGSAALNKGV
ncbi:MAG: ABC transporter ATP-binding protein [Lachnospiraceae bacterium]|nr:ABC transporter ATP-binding protein [Lachnospiraceae bacterium]